MKTSSGVAPIRAGQFPGRYASNLPQGARQLVLRRSALIPSDPSQFLTSSKKICVSRFVAFRNEMMRISCSFSVWTIDTVTPASNPSVTKRPEPVVLESECDAFENARCVNEIKPVVFQIPGALCFCPEKSYVRIVYTFCSCRKRGCLTSANQWGQARLILSNINRV